MKNQIKLLILAFCCCLAGCNSTPTSEIDAIFADYSGNRPGAAVLVIKGSKPILKRTYGQANIESRTAINDQTNFRLASISKHFTALAILILVDEGKLHLNSALPEIFMDFPAYGEQIRIVHLLQHRSGLLDYEGLVAMDAKQQVHDKDVLQLMRQQSTTYFPPGTAYRYSNSAYAVLAMIVEQVSGYPFHEFLEQRIFQASGLDRTLAHIDGVNTVAERAFGYTVTNGEVKPSDQSLYSAVLGDGGVYSSLEDLSHWHNVNYGADLISADLMQKALTPQLEHYGFGWRIDTYQGHRRYHHSGSTSGFRNFIARFPDEQLTIIVLTNRAEPDAQPLAQAVLDLYLKPRD
jgi:CubicO group peptidase (beta-lactamase class C family)